MNCQKLRSEGRKLIGNGKRRIFTLLVVVLVILPVSGANLCAEDEILVVTNWLPDGEKETRIRAGPVYAKETSFEMAGLSLKLRQMSDGSHFAQMIYDSSGLRDCEFGQDSQDVHEFIADFEEELTGLLTTNTSRLLVQKTSNANCGWAQYESLRDICRKRHRQIKHLMRLQRQRQYENHTNSVLSDDIYQPVAHSGNVTKRSKRGILVPGTLWCGQSKAAERYTELGLFWGPDKCCRRHDHCRLNVAAFENKYQLLNLRPYTVSHCFCDDSRCKRDLGDLMRVPGTKWCGKGYSATKYSQLGGHSRTDRCCRAHDTRCPFWIGGFETKYGLFNWRVNTLMHCACDERFRACLKMVGTGDANFVGKIFFNIIQSKCFVLKPKKVCRKRDRRGKCIKKKVIKKAVLRRNYKYK